MKRARIGPEELELEHVRDVLERKPVRGWPMGKRPLDVMEGEAAVYFRNFVNVLGVVEVDERKCSRLPEHEPNQRDQAGADSRDKPAFGNFIAHFADWGPGRGCAADKDRDLAGFDRQERVPLVNLRFVLRAPRS